MNADVRELIQPKSDQLNADDLVAGPITVTIEMVEVKRGDQPISVFLNGHKRPWKPCKSMARILAATWSTDSSLWAGKSLTLYCDPDVTWAGVKVGGIRISHMSDIKSVQTHHLTVTRGKRRAYDVFPLGNQRQCNSVNNQSIPEIPVENTALINHHKNILEMCDSMDNLVHAWGSIPKELKPGLESIKNDMKALISEKEQGNKQQQQQQQEQTQSDIGSF